MEGSSPHATSLAKCVGLYCGRVLYANNTLSPCSYCPIGTRSSSSYSMPISSNYTSQCLPCSASLGIDEWMYLLFNCILLLGLEQFIIDYCLDWNSSCLLHLSSLVEIVLSALCSLYSFSSSSTSIRITNFCGVHRLSDWYTLFFNPVPDFTNTIYCTQQSVYPLYSIPFVFLLFSLLFLVTIRPLVILIIGQSALSIYLTLYLIPLIFVIHALFAGIIYYSFSFITLFGSLISLASHFALRIDQRMSSLFIQSVSNPRTILIILSHWVLHAFGIISFFRLNFDYFYLIALIPFPSLFYIVTSKFTNPSKLKMR